MKRFTISLSIKTIFMIMVIMTLVTSNLNWGKDHWKGIVEADAKGYYAYLPAIFIYKDLNFGFFKKIEEEKKPETPIVKQEEKTVENENTSHLLLRYFNCLNR